MDASAKREVETNPQSDSSGIGGHPRGLTTLFFTELWERLSYYGMRAILVLYMVAPIAQGDLGRVLKEARVSTGGIKSETICGKVQTSILNTACLALPMPETVSII